MAGPLNRCNYTTQNEYKTVWLNVRRVPRIIKGRPTSPKPLFLRNSHRHQGYTPYPRGEVKVVNWMGHRHIKDKTTHWCSYALCESRMLAVKCVLQSGLLQPMFASFCTWRHDTKRTWYLTHITSRITARSSAFVVACKTLLLQHKRFHARVYTVE